MSKFKSFLAIFFLFCQVIWISSCKKTDITYSQLTLTDRQSYDFSQGSMHELSNGDFYYFCTASHNHFYANNVGQRGVIDMGDLADTDLVEVTIPTTGYTRFGVACAVNHIYISLAQEGEEGHYVIFKVLSMILDTSCTIEWLYK